MPSFMGVRERRLTSDCTSLFITPNGVINHKAMETLSEQVALAYNPRMEKGGAFCARSGAGAEIGNVRNSAFRERAG